MTDLKRERAFRRWFGASRAVQEASPGFVTPRRMIHTTRSPGFERFETGRRTRNSNAFGNYEVCRHAIFVTPSAADSNAFAAGACQGEFISGASSILVFIKSETPLNLMEGLTEADFDRLLAAGFSSSFLCNQLRDWDIFDDDAGAETVAMIRSAGYDSVNFWDQNPITGRSFEAWALFEPGQIVHALQYPEASTLLLPAKRPLKTAEPRILECAI